MSTLTKNIRTAIAFIDPFGKSSKVDRRKVPDNSILELCDDFDRLQAKNKKLRKKVKDFRDDYKKTLEAAKHPVKKTVKKLKSDTGCKGIC